MKSQFDKISASLQDLLGEAYDYKSIMHYDSTAFSRNGQNTIETVADGFTQVIGSAGDLSLMDIKKVWPFVTSSAGPVPLKRLPSFRSTSCTAAPHATPPRRQRRRGRRRRAADASLGPRLSTRVCGGGSRRGGGRGAATGQRVRRANSGSKTKQRLADGDHFVAGCDDHFADCKMFEQYCKRASFYFVMKSYCPRTCKHCQA